MITHRLLINAPPQLSFLVKNPVFTSAACHGCVPNCVECPPTIRLDLVYNSPQAKNTIQQRENRINDLKLLLLVNESEN